MGRKKEQRTRTLYVRINPVNYNFIHRLAKTENIKLSIWLDGLIDALRGRNKPKSA